MQCQLAASGPVSASPSPTTASHQQVGIVEGGPEGVDQRVAQLAALVDRAGRLGRGVAGNASREGELVEEGPHPGQILGHLRIDLAVGAFQVGVGHHPGTAVAGAADVDDVEVPGPDDPVEVGVDEVETGCRPPVTEQPGLDVLGRQRLAQQRVVQQVDLPDRQVVGRPPVGVDQLHLGRRKRHGVSGQCHHGPIVADRRRGSCRSRIWALSAVTVTASAPGRNRR